MELPGVREEDMPGLHIYTKAAQLGTKQIFGDHGTVLSVIAFRHHAFCPPEIVKFSTISRAQSLNSSLGALVLPDVNF